MMTLELAVQSYEAPLPKCFHGIIANGDKVVNGFDQNIKINDGEKGKTDVFTPERLNDLGSKSSPFSRLNVAHNRCTPRKHAPIFAG
jgi:hypothetical protein